MLALVAIMLAQYPQPRRFLQPDLTRSGGAKVACVFSVSPTVGATAGGNTLTLTGAGLSTVTGVTVGGTACTGVSAAETVVTCTAPAKTSGAYTVVATRSDGLTCSGNYAACDDATNLISGPGDMRGGETFGNEWWTAIGTGVAAPTKTPYYDTDPGGGIGAMRVQFAAVPSASKESTISQQVAACIGKTCNYSIYLRATPGGSGPSSGNLPIAMADNGSDGHGFQLCPFTTDWSRCELTMVNGGTFAYFWIGYASFGAGFSGTGPAMDLELFGPQVTLGPDAGVYACTPYVVTLATSDWGMHVRDGAGLVAYTDGTLLLLGGWYPNDVAEWGNNKTNNEVWLTADQGASWTRVLTNDSSPPQSNTDGGRWRWRHSHGTLAATFSGTEYAYVLGGDFLDSYFGGANGPYPQDVWRTADKGATWELMTGDAGWGSRVLHGVWAQNGNLYVGGGQADINDAGSGLIDVWKSTDQGATWSRVTADAGWLARGSQIQPVVTAGKAWVMGGQVYNGGGAHVRYNDVWTWDGGNGGAFTNVTADAGWVPRGYLNTNYFDGRFWVLRGNYGESNVQDVNDAWWSTDGITWNLNQWSAGAFDTHAGSAGVSSNTLVIAGGVIANGDVGLDAGRNVYRMQKGGVLW